MGCTGQRVPSLLFLSTPVSAIGKLLTDSPIVKSLCTGFHETGSPTASGLPQSSGIPFSSAVGTGPHSFLCQSISPISAPPSLHAVQFPQSDGTTGSPPLLPPHAAFSSISFLQQYNAPASSTRHFYRSSSQPPVVSTTVTKKITSSHASRSHSCTWPSHSILMPRHSAVRPRPTLSSFRIPFPPFPAYCASSPSQSQPISITHLPADFLQPCPMRLAPCQRHTATLDACVHLRRRDSGAFRTTNWLAELLEPAKQTVHQQPAPLYFPFWLQCVFFCVSVDEWRLVYTVSF